jgi:hypothetical protein
MGGADLLLARVQPDRYGVDYVRTDLFESPIPPLRAEKARDLGARKGRWAQRFADALAGNARGPLHAGRWALTSERPRRDDMVLTDRNGEIDWFRHNGSWQILPLRGLSDPAAGRVKSYRKQARDGVLPPVLLWWISGLDLYVVLDGHDRLVAALAKSRRSLRCPISTPEWSARTAAPQSPGTPRRPKRSGARWTSAYQVPQRRRRPSPDASPTR